MKYDVVIIGAGPAGSTAAKFLSEKGINVLLLDKSKFPRDKPCGGGIPTRAFKRFKYINDDWIESYSYGAYAYSSSLNYKLNLMKDEPLVAMTLRKKFDNELVKLAIDSGSTFLDGKKVEDIKILEDKAQILLNDNSNIESQIVIGADGVWSPIAKKAGLRQNSKNICMCLYQEYPISSDVLDDFFSEKRFCHIHMMLQGVAGYSWVFPKKEHLNIGITEFKQAEESLKRVTNLKDAYKSYIKILKENKIIPDSLEVGRIKGAALPICPLEKTYSDRILLCGDAAGFASPATGEGIYYAMASGEIAANVISKALDLGDTSEKILSKYQTIWKKDFGKELKLLLNLSYLWGADTEKIFRLISKDKKFTDMTRDIVTGIVSIHEYRWKIARRYMYLRFKDRFSKNH